MAAYNFARRLKTLGGLTPYEYICKVWTSDPDRFILDPIHQMPGLNIALVPINGTRSKALRSEQGVLGDFSVICHHLTMHLPSRWG